MDSFLTDPPNNDDSTDGLDFAHFVVDQFDVLDWINQPDVHKMKELLVPKQTTEELFWKRFMYQLRDIRADEVRRLASLLSSVDQMEDDEEDEVTSWTCEDEKGGRASEAGMDATSSNAAEQPSADVPDGEDV